jgi:acyl carrier protein
MDNLDINERFFNLDAATLANIHEFKRSRDPALVRPIFEEIMRSYLPEPARDLDEIPADSTFTSFGLDSLTLLEIILDSQDAFDVLLIDEEVRELTTPQKAYALIARKVDASSGQERPPASSDAAQ